MPSISFFWLGMLNKNSSVEPPISGEQERFHIKESVYLPTVREMSPLLVRYSTKGSVVSPEPNRSTRLIAPAILDDINMVYNDSTCSDLETPSQTPHKILYRLVKLLITEMWPLHIIRTLGPKTFVWTAIRIRNRLGHQDTSESVCPCSCLE